MKKFLIFLCSLTLVLAVTMSASAGLVTITFDEEGISANCPPQGAGDLITDQYNTAPMDWGVNWIVTGTDPYTDNTNEVTRGECFNNTFPDTGHDQILWYNSEYSGLKGEIQLDFLANHLAFDYRRPAQARDVYVTLYNGDVEVWATDPPLTADAYWQTFEHDAVDPSGYFDRILMNSTHKFVIDNLEVNPLVIDKVRGVKEPGEKIRIIGSGFGEPQAESEVHIGPKVYGPGHTKIKLWTDTMIKVKLPNYKCAWFKGNDYRRRKIWVMVGGEGGVSSNVKGIKVFKPDTCP